MILHHFCWRSSKITLFWPKTLIFDHKSRTYPKKSGNSRKFLGIFGIFRVYGPIWAPYGPIWALMDPYGPLWAHKGPYGSIRAHMGPYGAHMGPYTRKIPKIPRNFREFPDFFGYVRDLWSNIKVFGQNNVIFELLQQK